MRRIAFRSLRSKLLTLTIALSLVPLAGISAFSYFIGSKQIAADRIKLSLEKMAQDTADKIDIMLQEKREEIRSMGSTFPLLYGAVHARDRESITLMLNNFCFNHEVYDALMIIDRGGTIVAVNTVDRFSARLQPARLARVVGRRIDDFPEERDVFAASASGGDSHRDWYRSKIVAALYDYTREDSAQQYNIALSMPIQNPRTKEVLGVWINIVNWSYIQRVLDRVETDLQNLGMQTGYAFMYKKDADTIIAHKYRGFRTGGSGPGETTRNLYNTSLVRDHGLRNLHEAVVRREHSFAYEFPKGNSKRSGIAAISDVTFGWIVGVGIDDADIFRPITALGWWLLAATLFMAALVIVSTYWIAAGITVPLKTLTDTAQTIAKGNYSRRVPVQTSDEVGILGSAFNDMARALSARETELQELNKNLEGMVRQRTRELQSSHEALQQAYEDLQNAQEQLVQTEKMASLGQLVAGIAHEIKNPLNFIYGNTSFLSDYVGKLERLLESYERLSSLSADDREAIERYKKEVNYTFLKEDLGILVDNFSEGARRINAIVSDLRTFSRMDTEVISEIDLHSSLDMSLNLLRNQYKNRVEIHREYGDLPRIQGYSGKLSQVFMNLLANAFHAIEGKGDVWIRTRANDGRIEIEIEDNGVGISRENLKRIFEPFFTTKGVGQGTGLGLSISYGIVEQHRGQIHVRSTPARGSVFTVELPAEQARAEA